MERNNKGQFVKGHKGYKGMLGKKHKKETIEKFKKDRIGRKNPHTKEWNEKIRRAHLDRGLSWYKKCETCNKEFKVYRSRPEARFCSCKCRAQKIMCVPISRTGCIPWNKNLTKETNEKLKKISEDRMGEKNWMWKGGGYKREKSSREEKEWQKKVFEREDYICKKCKQKGKVLNAHHIKSWAKYPELRFETSNGITFCESCHKELHKRYGYFVDEKQLQEFLRV